MSSVTQATDAVSEQAQLFASDHPASAALHERALRVLPGGVSHNLRRAHPFPLSFVRGAGPYKWDLDGKRYLDYGLGAASLLLGHAHPSVTEAVASVGANAVPAACHELEVLWAESIAAMIPTAEQTRFTGSGTEATLLALRIARAFTGRDRVARVAGHYHGWQDYVMVGMRPPYDRPTSAGVPATTLSSVLTVTPTMAGLDDFERVLSARDIAAVILEPSGASWGTVPLPEGFLDRLRAITARTGTLLIFDEVITAFRWAPGGVQQLSGVHPDLTTLAKVLTGGFPGGAVTGRAEVMEVLMRGNAFHYGTFNSHPVSAAAGLATLLALVSGDPQRRADDHARTLRGLIQDTLDRLEIAGFVYGESSTMHIYLQAPGPAADPDCSLARTESDALLSIPPSVVQAFQLALRSEGLDPMSYTGAVVSSEHGSAQLDEGAAIFETVLTGLRDRGIVAVRG